MSENAEADVLPEILSEALSEHSNDEKPSATNLESTEEDHATNVPAKRGRPRIPSAERKQKKKETNKSYYQSVKKQIKSKASTGEIPNPTPKKQTQAQKKSTSSSSENKKPSRRPRSPEMSPRSPEMSPRSKLLSAYRDVKNHQREQKIMRYKSWFS